MVKTALNVLKIKKTIDQAIIDYVEGEIGVGKLEEIADPFDNAKVYSVLEENGFGELIVIISRLADMTWYTSRYGYNPKDPGSVQNFLENYYQKIKRKTNFNTS